MSITTREISNYDDMIDSRDVIARIEELEATIAEVADLESAETLTDDERHELEDLRAQVADEADELRVLRELAEEGANSAEDWQYGATLVRDSYFVDYAQELAEDIGAIKSVMSWPYSCIDWQQAARDLQMDYSAVEFDGVTYWVR